MFRSNQAMQELLHDEYPLVAGEIKEILSGGFFEKEGCFFIKNLYKKHYNSYRIENFYDETGFEAFVNSIQMSDYFEEYSVGDAMLLACETLKSFSSAKNQGELVSMISVDGSDILLKFYVRRKGQNYAADDLEGYATAVLEMDLLGASAAKIDRFSV